MSLLPKPALIALAFVSSLAGVSLLLAYAFGRQAQHFTPPPESPMSYGSLMGPLPFGVAGVTCITLGLLLMMLATKVTTTRLPKAE